MVVAIIATYCNLLQLIATVAFKFFLVYRTIYKMGIYHTHKTLLQYILWAFLVLMEQLLLLSFHITTF